MYKVYHKPKYNFNGQKYFVNTFFGNSNQDGKRVHNTSINNYPRVALKLPTNVVNINEAEMGRFSPLRERDIAGTVINALSKGHELSRIDITTHYDPYANKYDCRGAVSLSSSMQSNVPNPFSGNHTHLNMPGSQWGQGYKYLSDNLHSAHYLTLRNEFRDKQLNKVIAISTRNMSTEPKPLLSAKDKLKRTFKEYGSTVIVFHVSLSLLSLGGCYALVSSGIDVMALLKYFNMSEGALSSAAASNTGTFVIAYGIHKIFAPARIAITLTATPFIVRYLRSIGFLKHNGGGQ